MPSVPSPLSGSATLVLQSGLGHPKNVRACGIRRRVFHSRRPYTQTMHLLLTLLLAAVVKEPGAKLRSGCSADTSSVAELKAGTEVSIRYSLSGEKAPCYKVSVKSDVGMLEGYLSDDAVAGTESFDSARRNGGNIEARSAHGKSITGTHVLLNYEGAEVSVDTARDMAAVVDREFARISAQLGCTSRERIVTMAQAIDTYKQSGVPEWSGGGFDGRIHVPVFHGRTLDEPLRRTLAHETAHACLAMLGRWPSWLHEGIAQYVSGATLAPESRERIAMLARTRKLPTLDGLGDDWSKFDADQARVAYDVALYAVEIFNRDFGTYGLRNLLNNPAKLPYYTAELDKRLTH